MLNSITKADLDKLIGNFRINKDLPFITDAAFITRKHLDEFVKGQPPNCDALKICFVRFPSIPPDPDKILAAGNNLTQVSLIFVPLKETNLANWTSTEIADANGNIETLCVCEPGVLDPATGVCPPKKGCPT